MEGTPGRLRLDNELALIEQAKTDDKAFGILYDFYFPKIYFFVLKRVGQKETAEDIVSVTFIKVFTNIKKFKPVNEYSFSVWVYRIATNNLTDHYRKQGKHKTVDIENLGEILDHLQNPELDLEVGQDKDLVRQALNDLSTRESEILQLKFYGELGNIEIAEVLKTSPNNAGVMLHRALKKFQIKYQKYAK